MSTVEPSLPFDNFRCRRCGYALTGLPETRCPECGSAFDPTDPRTCTPRSFATQAQEWANRVAAIARLLRTRVRPALPFAIGNALSWTLYSGGLSFLLWLPAAVLGFRRRPVAASMCVLLGPIGVLLASSCCDYARGGYRFVRPAYSAPQIEQGNLDAVTRLRGFDPGCGTHDENRWVGTLAERAAIAVMSRAIGPPPGAYDGPYPTRAEALAALAAAGVTQGPGAIDNGTIELPSGSVRLRSDIAYCILRVERPDPSPTTATLYGKRCLIVRVPRDASPRLATVHLLDVQTGAAFAVYRDDDDASP